MRKKLLNYILSRIFLVVMLSVFFYGISFFYIENKISDEGVAMKENRSYAKSFESEDETVARLEKDYKVVEKDYDKIFNALPSKEKIIDYIEELEVIAEKTHNSQNLNISDRTEDQAGKKVIRIEINIVGTYSSFVQYLRYLENLAYFTKIDSIKLNKTESGEISAVFNAMLYIIEKDER